MPQDAEQLEANKAVIRRIYDEAYNGGDPSIFDTLYTPDFVHHSKTIHDITPGAAGERESMQRFRGAIPDVHFTLLQQVAEGDMVATRLRIAGTPEGDFGTIRGRDETFEVHALALFRLSGGRVAEEWLFVDGGTELESRAQASGSDSKAASRRPAWPTTGPPGRTPPG